jgi:hypothetical protein
MQNRFPVGCLVGINNASINNYSYITVTPGWNTTASKKLGQFYIPWKDKRKEKIEGHGWKKQQQTGA